MAEVAVDIGSGALTVAENGLTLAGAAALLQKPYKAIKQKLSKKMIEAELDDGTDEVEQKDSLIITEFNFQDELKKRD